MLLLLSDWRKDDASGTLGQYKIGFYVVMAALLFNMLANRFIRRDEKLVRSADRIR